MRITKDQIKVLHALLPKSILQDKEAKQAFVHQFSKDVNRISTTALTFEEANTALQSLGGKPFKRPFNRIDKWQKFDYKKKSHLNILSLLIQLDWKWKSELSNRYFADMVRFSKWLQTKAPVKKPLNDMDAQEISKTIVALENMAAGKEKKTLRH